MPFAWLEQRRWKRILETPAPSEWLDILARNIVHFRHLDRAERKGLVELVQLFIPDKDWEGCGGLTLTDEIRVTIAGQACLLVLGLDHVLYRNVATILVYPTTVMPKRVVEPMFAAPVVVDDVMPVLGEAHLRGPVILTWDAVRRGGIHPERGHNVVFHEFAHKLDMLDGAADGTPPMSRPLYQRWVRVCTAEYERLRDASDRGELTLLDPYGGTNVAEFFAVATEIFFDKPGELRARHPELYEVLQGFYRQDPAAREARVS